MEKDGGTVSAAISVVAPSPSSSPPSSPPSSSPSCSSSSSLLTSAESIKEKEEEWPFFSEWLENVKGINEAAQRAAMTMFYCTITAADYKYSLYGVEYSREPGEVRDHYRSILYECHGRAAKRMFKVRKRRRWSYVCVYVCMFVCMYVYVCMYMFVCLYVCVCFRDCVNTCFFSSPLGHVTIVSIR